MRGRGGGARGVRELACTARGRGGISKVHWRSSGGRKRGIPFSNELTSSAVRARACVAACERLAGVWRVAGADDVVSLRHLQDNWSAHPSRRRRRPSSANSRREHGAIAARHGGREPERAESHLEGLRSRAKGPGKSQGARADWHKQVEILVYVPQFPPGRAVSASERVGCASALRSVHARGTLSSLSSHGPPHRRTARGPQRPAP